MPHLADFEAWVEVDGARLPEYPVEPDGNSLTVRCWIPSEEGKNFVVHWRDHGILRTTACFISVDGQSSHGSILQPGNPLDRHGKRCGRYISERQLTLYQFGTMALTDDENLVLEDEATLKALGNIELCIKHGSVVGPSPFTPIQVPMAKPVHEKMKKAGGHRVVSGETVQTKHSYWNRFIWDCSPLIKFIFQYRPKGILQALDIIPHEERIATPGKRGAKRDIEGNDDDDDDDEGEEDEEDEESDAEKAAKIRQLEEQLAVLRDSTNQKAKKAAVKREGRPTKRMKLEEINTNRLFASGEIIDLT